MQSSFAALCVGAAHWPVPKVSAIGGLLSQPGADYLFACSGIQTYHSPKDVVDSVELLTAGGVSFTLSSGLVDTGTEVLTTAVDPVLGRKAVRNTLEDASRLGCKRVIIGECGCGVRAHFVALRSFIGADYPDIEIIYVDALLPDLIE